MMFMIMIFHDKVPWWRNSSVAVVCCVITVAVVSNPITSLLGIRIRMCYRIYDMHDFTLFVIDIYIRLCSFHFLTPFDHFHFHPTSGLGPDLILTVYPNAIYDQQLSEFDFLSVFLQSVPSLRIF